MRLPGQLLQSLSLHSRPLLTHASAGAPQSKAGLSQSLMGSCSFPSSWCAQGFVCALQASLAGMRFDFKCDCPLLPFVAASPLPLDAGYLFFLVGSSILLSMVVQQLFVILVFSQEMSAWSSTPPSLYPPDKIPWTGHKTYTCRFQQDRQPLIVI